MNNRHEDLLEALAIAEARGERDRVYAILAEMKMRGYEVAVIEPAEEKAVRRPGRPRKARG